MRPDFSGKEYEIMMECLNFFMYGKEKTDTCDTHNYLQTEANVIFTQMNDTKGSKLL